MGNTESPDTILRGIKPYRVAPDTIGELVVRVFQYLDVFKVIKVVASEDVIITYPDVFPLGRYYDEPEYKKMVQEVFAGANCDVLDLHPSRTETDEAFRSPACDIFWRSTYPSCTFINKNTLVVFGNINRSNGTKNAKRVDPSVAKHIGSKLVAFVAADPEPEVPQTPEVPTQEAPQESDVPTPEVPQAPVSGVPTPDVPEVIPMDIPEVLSQETISPAAIPNDTLVKPPLNERLFGQAPSDAPSYFRLPPAAAWIAGPCGKDGCELCKPRSGQ